MKITIEIKGKAKEIEALLEMQKQQRDAEMQEINQTVTSIFTKAADASNDPLDYK